MVLVTSVFAFAAEPSATLPKTATLEWPEADLSTRLMDGAHRFVERKIAEAPVTRSAFWVRDYASAAAYEQSIQPNRERFKTIIGAVDARRPAAMEYYGDDANPMLVAETPQYQILQVRWPVLEGVWGTGLLLQPKSEPRAHLVVVPDAAETPEQYAGIADGAPRAAAFVRRLVENGCEVVIPVTISSAKLKTDDPAFKKSDQTYREWIYRQAYQMGRHVVGYEVQVVLSAVDWLESQRRPGAKIGVAGYAEGGLVAFYAAAVDSRIDAALVSGYFDSREQVWSEPIYRNVWGLLREFGDAEIASLVLPRALLVEASQVSDIKDHKGERHTPPLERVRNELQRVRVAGTMERPMLVSEKEAGAEPFSPSTAEQFARRLGLPALAPLTMQLPIERRTAFDAAARHERFFREMEGHVQMLLRRSDQVRDANFLFKVMPELADTRWNTQREYPTQRPDKFIAAARAYRIQFQDEAMGRFDEPLVPFNARTRLIAKTAKWTAYDVVLDVWPEVFAWGVLVLPNDLKPGERRPVVVCQHGRNGVPRDTLDANNPAYNNFAATLAERGFITFAPHNLYRGEDRYRWLCRKANTVKATLFSFIIAQHDQILRWLGTQPFVDSRRIAFYGLSYGGETAVRVPTILEGYALSICSGDFNEWNYKVASTEQPWSFMRTIEWEMPYWNLGNTFDYAEMAYLMIPRPFMVERGHHDRVGRDAWVSHEYAKVRWLYDNLGLGDRTQIEYFMGGHSIRGEGTFDFLHKQLNWPKPGEKRH